MLGDDDGVVVMAREHASKVLEKSLARMEDEAREIEEEISKGKLILDFFSDLVDELELPDK